MSTVDDLVRVYRSSAPQDVSAGEIGRAIATTVATILGVSADEGVRLANGAHLHTATGSFLDLHAQDRGLRRQDGESDDQLRERLRTPPRAGTVSSILEAVQQIVGLDEVIFLIEIPRQGAFFSGLAGDTLAATYVSPSFFNVDARGRMGGGRGVVVVLIPESADALESVTDVVRTKVSAGKLWRVEEYS